MVRIYSNRSETIFTLFIDGVQTDNEKEDE